MVLPSTHCVLDGKTFKIQRNTGFSFISDAKTTCSTAYKRNTTVYAIAGIAPCFFTSFLPHKTLPQKFRKCFYEKGRLPELFRNTLHAIKRLPQHFRKSFGRNTILPVLFRKSFHGMAGTEIIFYGTAYFKKRLPTFCRKPQNIIYSCLLFSFSAENLTKRVPALFRNPFHQKTAHRKIKYVNKKKMHGNYTKKSGSGK